MSSVRVDVDTNASTIMGSNGLFTIAELEIFDAGSNITYIDGIGKRNTAINGGLAVDTKSFVAAVKAYLEGHGYTITKERR